MSFASCTGTTRETCRPPCELHFHPNGVDVLDVYCVPPSEALGHPLSDKDLKRIKALLSGVITGPQTGVIDDAIRNLHAGMRAFIDDRIKQHTSSQYRRTSEDWEQIASSITSEVLNDVYNLKCPICIEGFDNHRSRAFVLTCPSGERTPMHIDCYGDLLSSGEGGANCPMCRQPLDGTHNEPPKTFAWIAKQTVSLANREWKSLVHPPEPPEGWPDRTWGDTFADTLVYTVLALLLVAVGSRAL